MAKVEKIVFSSGEFLTQTPAGSIQRRRCSSGQKSPCSIESPASDGSTSWNGVIPRVRRKYVDVVEGIVNELVVLQTGFFKAFGCVVEYEKT